MKKRLFSTLACLALVMTTISTYGYCYWTIHQEELPVEAKKLLKGKK